MVLTLITLSIKCAIKNSLKLPEHIMDDLHDHLMNLAPTKSINMSGKIYIPKNINVADNYLIIEYEHKSMPLVFCYCFSWWFDNLHTNTCYCDTNIVPISTVYQKILKEHEIVIYINKYVTYNEIGRVQIIYYP